MTPPNVLLMKQGDERTPHSTERMMQMMALSMSAKDLESPALTENDELWSADSLFQMAKPCAFLRLQNAGITITQAALALMISLGEMTPGGLVMSAYTLKCIAEHEDKSHLTVADVATAFTFDAPSHLAWERAWDGQKIGGANWLDTVEAWTTKWTKPKPEGEA